MITETKYNLRLKLEPRNLWIGLYWDVNTKGIYSHVTTFDFYLCLIPCLPLHLKVTHSERCTRK